MDPAPGLPSQFVLVKNGVEGMDLSDRLQVAITELIDRDHFHSQERCPLGR
jgi:hypothetical protein